MRLELQRVAPLRAANVMAIVYAALMAVMVIPMFLMMSVMPTPDGADPRDAQATFSALRWFVLAYPLMGAVMGWLGGLTGAWVYNQVAFYFGGLRLEFLHMDR